MGQVVLSERCLQVGVTAAISFTSKSSDCSGGWGWTNAFASFRSGVSANRPQLKNDVWSIELLLVKVQKGWKALWEQRERKGGTRRWTSLPLPPLWSHLFPSFSLCKTPCLPFQREESFSVPVLSNCLLYQKPALQTSRKDGSSLASSLGATASGEEAAWESEKVTFVFCV